MLFSDNQFLTKYVLEAAHHYNNSLFFPILNIAIALSRISVLNAFCSTTIETLFCIGHYLTHKTNKMNDELKIKYKEQNNTIRYD